MNNLREALHAQLVLYDDEAYAALANRGLLRRARKDLLTEKAEIVEDAPSSLVVRVGPHRVQFDGRGPAYARCSCAARGGCQHVVAAAIVIGSAAAADPVIGVSSEEAGTPAQTPADSLRGDLLKIPAQELRKFAGKAGYRWAWQFVVDLDIERDLTLSGDRHVVITFRHPPVSFRYMGGPIGALLPDTQLKQPAKYQAAAVLAFQRAHGKLPEQLEESTPRGRELNLGKDHELAEAGPSATTDSRARLVDAVRQLACECVTLGLAHLSPGIHERFATMSVWAQGAQCYRLAILLRRITDHVEVQLERAGGADEERLFNELALLYALASAIGQANTRGDVPSALIGRARNEYEEVAQLELLGLGASAWRSPSGYQGLTMLFWSPSHGAFYSCTDARPEVQRGFDPRARYNAPGPWAGLGGPALASGRRVVLTGAMTSSAGRISASEKIVATVMPGDAQAFVSQLQTYSRWEDLSRERATMRRSLLAEPQPLKDWVVLHPTRFRRATFDAARQAVVWGLIDDRGAVLSAELSHDTYTAPAIERLEQLGEDEKVLVVARLRGGSSNVIAEPLSLVRLDASGDQNPVDSLYFDPAPKEGFVSRFRARLRARPEGEAPVQSATGVGTPPVLTEARRWIGLQAERGIAGEAMAVARTELARRLERLAAAGYSVFAHVDSVDLAAALLRAQYLCMQYIQLMDDSGDALG